MKRVRLVLVVLRRPPGPDRRGGRRRRGNGLGPDVRSPVSAHGRIHRAGRRGAWPVPGLWPGRVRLLPRGARAVAGARPRRDAAARGAHVFPLPFGRIYSANITPDPETGIGRRTDGELARILRHGVRADGHAAVPLMEYQGMADEDLVAVISFLRSRPAVRNVAPAARTDAAGQATDGVCHRPDERGIAAASDESRRVPPSSVGVPGHQGVSVRVVSHQSRRARRAGGPAVWRRPAHGRRGGLDEGLRHAEPDAGPGDERDREVDRGRVRAAFPPGRAGGGIADAVGRVRANDRRRPAQRVSLLAQPAAGRARHGTEACRGRARLSRRSTPPRRTSPAARRSARACRPPAGSPAVRRSHTAAPRPGAATG